MSTRMLPALDMQVTLVYNARAKRPRITPSEESVSRVKRCLFGPRKAEEAFSAREEAEALLRQSWHADKEKYNFDFYREIPLEGNYQWSLVTQAKTSSNSRPNSPVSEELPSIAANPRQTRITDFFRSSRRRVVLKD